MALSFPAISDPRLPGNPNNPLSSLGANNLQSQIDNITPGHNFIEIISPTPDSILNSRVFEIIGRTMRRHGVDGNIPEVKINNVLLNEPDIYEIPNTSIIEFKKTLNLVEEGNTVTLTSDNTYFLSKTVNYTINTPPIISDITINYPPNQIEVKMGDVFTVDITVTEAFTDISYTSPNFTITNDTTYETTKILTFTANGGITQHSGINLTVIASNSLNNTSSSRDFLINIDDILPNGAITFQRNQTGAWEIEPYLGVGLHNIRITSDYNIHSDYPPTMEISEGTLGTFTGSGKIWDSTVEIYFLAPNNGISNFSNIALYSESLKLGNTLRNSLFHYDKVVPNIVSSTISLSEWWSVDGSITISLDCGENSSGFTAFCDLSAFGGSATASFTTDGANGMNLIFTPVKQNVSNSTISITLYDQAKNSSSVDTSLSLTTHEYRINPEILAFGAYSSLSDPLTNSQTFFNDTLSKVKFTEGSEAFKAHPDFLIFGTDYTVTNSNSIQLNTTTFSNEIAANALGLLTVNVFED